MKGYFCPKYEYKWRIDRGRTKWQFQSRAGSIRIQKLEFARDLQWLSQIQREMSYELVNVFSVNICCLVFANALLTSIDLFGNWVTDDTTQRILRMFIKLTWRDTLKKKKLKQTFFICEIFDKEIKNVTILDTFILLS